MRPSEYMATRIWHGFIDDSAAEFSIPRVGPSQVLWGSDFPHPRSIGLDAQTTLNKLVESLPQKDQSLVVGGNAAKVFNLD